MSNELPVQKFQIGQRVRRANDDAFVIRMIYFTTDDRVLYAPGAGCNVYEGDQLTLAPERKPYERTARRTVPRTTKAMVSIIDYVNALYRPETDKEMDDRHAVERAEHDAQGWGAGP